VAKLEQHPFTAAPKEWLNVEGPGSANSDSISLVEYVDRFVVDGFGDTKDAEIRRICIFFVARRV
jgi:hypothetical protein